MRGSKTPCCGNYRNAPQGIFKGETWQSHVSPLKIPLGRAASCLKAEWIFPAHLPQRIFKEIFVTQ
jgi:hypothetical protein